MPTPSATRAAVPALEWLQDAISDPELDAEGVKLKAAIERLKVGVSAIKACNCYSFDGYCGKCEKLLDDIFALIEKL